MHLSCWSAAESWVHFPAPNKPGMTARACGPDVGGESRGIRSLKVVIPGYKGRLTLTLVIWESALKTFFLVF